MARIVISENVSLDGVMGDPTGEEGSRQGGWFQQFLNGDSEAWAQRGLEEARGAAALLVGRRSDEYFGSRWNSRDGEWADTLNSLPKYVVSSTLEDPVWINSTVLKGDAVSEVARLKQQLDGEIVCIASRQLVADAARARPGRRGTAGRLPSRARGGGAALRRDQRQDVAAPSREPDHRQRPGVPQVRGHPSSLTLHDGKGRRARWVRVRLPFRRRCNVKTVVAQAAVGSPWLAWRSDARAPSRSLCASSRSWPRTSGAGRSRSPRDQQAVRRRSS